MPILRSRRVAATLDELVIRVRRQVGDIIDDADPGAGNRKWEDTNIVDAINDMMAQMLEEQAPVASTMLTEQTVTYTGGSNGYTFASDDGDALGIYAVFALEGSKRILLRYVPYPEIEKYRVPVNEQSGMIVNERYWSRLDDQLLIRPIPSADLTLYIGSFGAPFAMDVSSGTDQHPLPVAHEELLVLGASNRLQYPNDALPISRQMHYMTLWTKWLQACDRYAGPRFPIDSRRYRS